jgi:hypothetical protein
MRPLPIASASSHLRAGCRYQIVVGEGSGSGPLHGIVFGIGAERCHMLLNRVPAGRLGLVHFRSEFENRVHRAFHGARHVARDISNRQQVLVVDALVRHYFLAVHEFAQRHQPARSSGYFEVLDFLQVRPGGAVEAQH